MSKRNGRLTQKDLERLDREFGAITARGFDGGRVHGWMTEVAERYGVDPDRLASRLTAAGLRSALAALGAPLEHQRCLGGERPAQCAFPAAASGERRSPDRRAEIPKSPGARSSHDRKPIARQPAR